LKPAYAKRLQQDSTRIDNRHYQLTYTSSDKKTDIKKVILLFQDDNRTPLFVSAVMAEKNTLYESEKVLSWYTDSAFVIEGHQKVNLSDQLTYQVQGLLIRP
jgi:hypothetical protein